MTMAHACDFASQAALRISDWTLIFTTLFLGAVALFVPYLSEILKRKYFAPDLLIEFDQTPPDCHITRNKFNDDYGNILSDEPIYYFRFRVINKGKSQARRCEAVVEKLSVADASGKFIPYRRYTSVSLIWGSSYGEFVDINPERRFYCDLFNIPVKIHQEIYLKKNICVNPPESVDFDLGIILNVKAAFYSQPNRLPPGKYKVDVAVYCENSKTVRGSFEITWSGNWKDTEENMFKEIVVDFKSG
jgi:hypothetical protein